MAVGTQDCIKAADIAKLEQKMEDFVDWQSRQNGSLQAMENSIRLIAASADSRFDNLNKWIIGLQGSVILVLIAQIAILVRGSL